MSPNLNYESWTKEDLIAHITQLELNARARSAKGNDCEVPSKPAISISAHKKSFDFLSHPRRKIAIKFCYSGWEYNGLAFQNGPTPLPTVEEVLFNAFAKTRLVDPAGGLEGCGWERCGRTDKGVSGAGQVVSLWVRSALDEGSAKEVVALATSQADSTSSVTGEVQDRLPDKPTNRGRPRSEFRYVSILNRVLPPSIRVFAWSPVSTTFSARFNCKSRHYKYFFSPHALDVGLMQQAADRLVGEHDFRNLCKLDPTKQITNFKRNVLKATISSISNDLCVFDLMGTAFLYHQVRHIMALLFLVGTGLEHPSIVSSLLNVNAETNPPIREGDPPPEIVDCKPEYQMADGLPLMLWDCAFSDTDVKWQIDIDMGGSGTGSELYHQLHSIHERSASHTALNSHFLAAAARLHSPPPQYFPFSRTRLTTSTISSLAISRDQPILSVPLGGGTFKRTGKYVPVLQRKRLDSVEVANERWLLGKGGRREERKRSLP